MCSSCEALLPRRVLLSEKIRDPSRRLTTLSGNTHKPAADFLCHLVSMDTDELRPLALWLAMRTVPLDHSFKVCGTRAAYDGRSDRNPGGSCRVYVTQCKRYRRECNVRSTANSRLRERGRVCDSTLKTFTSSNTSMQELSCVTVPRGSCSRLSGSPVDVTSKPRPDFS